MRKDACTASGGLYRPRNPRASPLHQCVRRHYDELAAGGRFTRPVEEEVLTRFLDCGDLHQGFARIYCADCGHDYLLAFSCKARYFCPSCHQKRMLAYGEWVEENVLAPVPHRQYVFALPKLLRPYFRQRRERLGTLCQIIAQLLLQGFRTMAPEGRPGFILYVQTFGDLVTFNPHVHALVGGASQRRHPPR
jgi:transposase-like protein